MSVQVAEPMTMPRTDTYTPTKGNGKLVVFNDLHLADKPPLGRKEGFRDEGLAMLAECVAIAREHKAVLCSTGDLFDRKAPAHNSHFLIGAVRDILRDNPTGPLNITPGNHDMGSTGFKSVLPATGLQPLANLARSGDVNLLMGQTETYGDILICSRPYNDHLDRDPAYYRLNPKEELLRAELPSVFVVMLAHGSILPSHETRAYDALRIHQIDTTGIDVLASGHIHEDLGWHRPLLNYGALGRVKRTPENRTRTVQVALLQPGEEPVAIPLKSALPAADIFVEDTLSLPGNDALTQYVKDLTQGVVFETMNDVEAMLKGVEADDEVKRQVIALMEEAGL